MAADPSSPWLAADLPSPRLAADLPSPRLAADLPSPRLAGSSPCRRGRRSIHCYGARAGTTPAVAVSLPSPVRWVSTRARSCWAGSTAGSRGGCWRWRSAWSRWVGSLSSNPLATDVTAEPPPVAPVAEPVSTASTVNRALPASVRTPKPSARLGFRAAPGGDGRRAVVGPTPVVGRQGPTRRDCPAMRMRCRRWVGCRSRTWRRAVGSTRSPSAVNRPTRPGDLRPDGKRIESAETTGERSGRPASSVERAPGEAVARRPTAAPGHRPPRRSAASRLR